MPAVVIITGTGDGDELALACDQFDEPGFDVSVISTKDWATADLPSSPKSIVLGKPGRERVTDKPPATLPSTSWDLWSRYRDDLVAQQAVERADAVIALGESAIYTVWRLAKKRPALIASTSPATARGELDAR